MIRSLYLDPHGPVRTGLSAPELATALGSAEGLLWVDMEKPAQREAIALLSDLFHFHPLAIEDCFHPLQYSRIDGYAGYLFMVFHGLAREPGRRTSAPELDLFLGPNYVVTFRSVPLPCVDALFQAMGRDPGEARRGGDRLLHDLVRALVDSSFLSVINGLEQDVEELWRQVAASPRRVALPQVVALNADVRTARRTLVAVRETVSRLSYEALDNVRAESRAYFRNIYDHLVQATETVEALYDLSTDVLKSYAVSREHRINEAIKALAVAATVALGPSIVLRHYSINFASPEMDWRLGYLFVLLVSGATAAATLWLLRRKKWL